MSWLHSRARDDTDDAPKCARSEIADDWTRVICFVVPMVITWISGAAKSSDDKSCSVYPGDL